MAAPDAAAAFANTGRIMTIAAMPLADRADRPPLIPAPVAAALTGVLISAMMSGLNSRASSLALADIRGVLGIGIDQGSWIATLYSAGELLVMPFAGWFAVTFSVRRFYLWVLWIAAGIAMVTPLIQNTQLLLVLRFVQGISAGALIPLLMMMALRFLPPPIRLHGLALYALTATFTPNIAIWVVGQWSDGVGDLRWVAWQFLPVAVLCSALVGWGLPREPVNWARFRDMNWLALVTGAPGLALIAIGIAQGNRLDWLNSPLVCFCLLAGALCILVFLVSEWTHPAPFIRFQLLERRNLYVGFTAFVVILIALYSGASLPLDHLAATQGYRAMQAAPLGLLIGLPQLLLGFVVAGLLYNRRVDARLLFAAGMALIGASCMAAAHLDDTWTWREFVPVQLMQAVGQPLAIIPMLFLTTSVVAPSEGPFIAGLVNTLRAFGTLAGVALVGRLEVVREHLHMTVLSDRLGLVINHLPSQADVAGAGAVISAQATALTNADVYRVLGVLALAVVPAGLLFQHIPAPGSEPAAPHNTDKPS